MLCLVHCVATALLASLMPAAALWLHSDWLEGPLSILSVLIIGAMVLRRRRGIDRLSAFFLLSVSVGGAGCLLDVSFMRHGGLVLLVAVQGLWLLERRALHRQLHRRTEADGLAPSAHSHGRCHGATCRHTH
jgi:hypothetical protein